MSQEADQLVAAHWGKMPQDVPKLFSWTDSPTVQAHINRLITGNPHRGWLEYACRRYLLRNGKGVGRGLSIGCGAGSLERQARQMGACEVIDAYDIAPGAIEEAQKLAVQEGVHGINYALANLNELQLSEAIYDAVFASSSIHHIVKLENLFADIRRSLKETGFFIMLEYVGPSQFQFSAKVVRIINELLAILPPAYRQRSSAAGALKTEFQVVPIEHMNATDPSEAIRSADILPLLTKEFILLEKKDFGGTILHMLLQDIIHNFEDGTPGSVGMLNLLLYLETLLIQGICHGLRFLLCRRRTEIWPTVTVHSCPLKAVWVVWGNNSVGSCCRIIMLPKNWTTP